MKKAIAITCMLAVFFVALASATFAAQWANPELLMSAKDVKDIMNKPDWVILDCRKLKDYAKGHIPGAISIGKTGVYRHKNRYKGRPSGRGDTADRKG
jgi:3-mercaptopyruvate sulfurtransferase SseA